jgi:putative tryptophan/tyrosine transport system substrate-binding protein
VAAGGAGAAAPDACGRIFSRLARLSPAHIQCSEFRKELADAGFIEGQNGLIEFRWGNNQNDRLAELAADLVRRRVAVIATPSSMAAAVAAKPLRRRSRLSSALSLPGEKRPCRRLNRPGGNVTGIRYLNVELVAKHLGVLRALVPKAARFAVCSSIRPIRAPGAVAVADAGPRAPSPPLAGPAQAARCRSRQQWPGCLCATGAA